MGKKPHKEKKCNADQALMLDTKVDKELRKGNVIYASKLLQQLLNMGHTPAEKRLKECSNLLLRKAWRNSETERFINLSDKKPEYSLVRARLSGNEALKALANEDSIYGRLALWSLLNDAKDAIRGMRRDETLKNLAEGWLALLKGDTARAATSFTAAKDTQPCRTQIASGVTACLQSQYDVAEKQLASIRPFATKKFPVLSSLMGWGHPNKKSFTPNSIVHLLQTGSYSDLREAVNQKDFDPWKGWLLLRMGDHLALKGKQELSVKTWKKAKSVGKRFHCDAYKRLLWAYGRLADANNWCTTFWNLYNALEKESPDSCYDFIEEFVLFGNTDCIESLKIKGVDSSRSRWPKDIRPELQLLTMKRQVVQDAAASDIPEFLKMIVGSQVETLSPKLWEAAFPVLDKAYSHVEEYWRLRLALCQQYRKFNKERRLACFNLLKLNPFLAGELLPQYIDHSESSQRAFKQISSEIAVLESLLPVSYDLCRLKFVLKKRQETNEEIFGKLPPRLEAILRLDIALHTRFQWISAQGIKALIPDASGDGKSLEADHRLLALLVKSTFQKIDPHLSVQRFKNMATNFDRSKALIDKVTRERDMTISYPIIKEWNKLFPDHWEPLYKLAVYYCDYQGDNKRALPLLKRAYALMKGDEDHFNMIRHLIDEIENADEDEDVFLSTLLESIK